MLPFSAKDRVELYVIEKGLTINAVLGGGYDGYVVATDAGTVIKSFNHVPLYRNELRVYRYLARKQISFLSNFRIPKLLGFDDDSSLITMTLVNPPFVVDFAGASLTRPKNEFDEETMAYWRNQKSEEFGDDWPAVKRRFIRRMRAES